MIRVEAVRGVGRLGPEWDPLFAAGPGLQSRRAWFEVTEQAALPAGAEPYVVAAREEGRPLAVLPLQRTAAGRMLSLTSPYTVLFQPLLAPGADAAAVGRALGRHLRRFDLVRLEALDPAWPGLAPLLAGMRGAGMLAQRFDHFGNWHEDLAGRSWAEYLAARPGALRETIRRRGRAAAKDEAIRFETLTGGERLVPAMLAYEDIYTRSWKVPEPFPRFNATLLPRAAELGVLRMGVMWQGETPLAAQYWTVVDGVATVLKLAHDEAHKALSPGSLLTAHVIERLIDGEGVQALDFGRGDDPYKSTWTTARRQRIGVVLATPWRLRGAVELARHWAGLARRLLRGTPAGKEG